MPTIAHQTTTIQAPGQRILADTRQLIGEAQQFLAVLWQPHPLLHTLDQLAGSCVSTSSIVASKPIPMRSVPPR